MDLLKHVASLIAVSGVANVPAPEVEDCDCGPGEHDDVVYVGPYSIAHEERVIDFPSITGLRSVRRHQYVLEVEVRTPGTQWEPPGAELVEIGAFDHLHGAVGALLADIIRDRMDGATVSWTDHSEYATAGAR